MKTSLRRGVVVLVVVVSLLLLWRPLQSVLRAYALADAFATTHLRVMRRYVRTVSSKASMKDFQVPSEAGTTDVRMYVPEERPDLPIIVLVPGLVERGNKDGPTNTFGQRLGSIGYRVLIPDLPSTHEMRMDVDSVLRIAAVVAWASHNYGQKVSLMGTSFGGGLALRAATLPRYRDDVKLVFSIGGYNSMERMNRFYGGELPVGPDGRAVTVRAMPSARMLMALQHVEDLTSTKDAAALQATLIRVFVAPIPETEKTQALLQALTPSEQVEFRRLLTDSKDERERFYTLYSRHTADYDAISAHGALQNIAAPVFLLHGYEDWWVPVTEAEWTQQELVAAHHEVHLLKTNDLLHVQLSPKTNLIGKIRIGLFLARVLHRAAD